MAAKPLSNVAMAAIAQIELLIFIFLPLLIVNGGGVLQYSGLPSTPNDSVHLALIVHTYVRSLINEYGQEVNRNMHTFAYALE